MDECVELEASPSRDCSDDLPAYFWPLVVCGILALIAVIGGGVIWWAQKRRHQHTTSDAVIVPQHSPPRSFSMSSAWPSWKREDEQIVKDHEEAEAFPL